MSVVGGGNLYPNWLGSANLSIPNNQVVVNGAIVNVVPIYDLTNRSVSSVPANVKTLIYTLPGTYAAGVYIVGGEFQVQNTSGGQTAYAAGDGIDWIIQGIGDTNPDYSEASTQPFYTCVAPSTGTGAASSFGVSRLSPSGLTGITANGTQMGVYVRYTTASSATQNMTFTITGLSVQKIG
jgi:hypothetical protein